MQTYADSRLSRSGEGAAAVAADLTEAQPEASAGLVLSPTQPLAPPRLTLSCAAIEQWTILESHKTISPARQLTNLAAESLRSGSLPRSGMNCSQEG